MTPHRRSRCWSKAAPACHRAPPVCCANCKRYKQGNKMRIVIDLQGTQSESRFRGIGRYSLALALGVARNAGEHEIWLVMNGGLPAAIEDLRAQFAGLVPPERMRVFDIPQPCAERIESNSPRA